VTAATKTSSPSPLSERLRRAEREVAGEAVLNKVRQEKMQQRERRDRCSDPTHKKLQQRVLELEAQLSLLSSRNVRIRSALLFMAVCPLWKYVSSG
jgi:hypothetical protein